MVELIESGIGSGLFWLFQNLMSWPMANFRIRPPPPSRRCRRCMLVHGAQPRSPIGLVPRRSREPPRPFYTPLPIVPCPTHGLPTLLYIVAGKSGGPIRAVHMVASSCVPRDPFLRASLIALGGGMRERGRGGLPPLVLKHSSLFHFHTPLKTGARNLIRRPLA